MEILWSAATDVVHHIRTAMSAEEENSYSDSGEMGGDSEWDEWEEEDGEGAYGGQASLCMLCQSEFDSPDEALTHCAGVHGFDFYSARSELDLDDFDCIRFVNYLRQLAAKDDSLATATAFATPEKKEFSGKDEYLVPVIPGDPILCVAMELADDDTKGAETVNMVTAETTTIHPLLGTEATDEIGSAYAQFADGEEEAGASANNEGGEGGEGE